MTAFMRVNIYTVVLQFEAAVATTESFSVHKILMYLIREIIIRCLNTTFKDYV